MAKTVSKTLMVTRVTFKTVDVQGGEARFVDHPDAIFSGQLDRDKVERLLRAQLGKEAVFAITAVDAGQHRYEMDLATFILNSRIADGEPDEAPDSDADADSEPANAANSEPASSAAANNPAQAPAPTAAPAAPEQSSDDGDAVPSSDGDDDIEI